MACIKNKLNSNATMHNKRKRVTNHKITYVHPCIDRIMLYAVCAKQTKSTICTFFTNEPSPAKLQHACFGKLCNNRTLVRETDIIKRSE